MFTKILVPLDGSVLAERALQPALTIAEKLQSELFLLRIVMPEETRVALPAMAPQAHDMHNVSWRQEEEADVYLHRIQLDWLGSNVPISTQVLRGAPPEMIVAAANERRVDLIVMSTHGRSGFERLIYGSVAEAVMRGAHVPVLLVPCKA